MDPAMAYEIQGLSYQRAMNEVMARGDSEIQMFYNGLTIFVTGGTGFIGKHLIEKLLRSCDIKEIFVLIRPKRGMAVEERLQEMLSDPVFDAVRKNKPYFNERIVAVEGDVAEIGLALNAKDRETITSEVDIIFHVAATIKFDEAIRFATITNVRGTREAIKLGKACHKLKSFIHVSTAYSHTTTRRVGGVLMEQFYECPVSPEVMIRLAEMDDDLELVTLTARLQKDWPNSYTFTKAIAEEVVRTESGDMRVTIVRPSIVLSTYIEPTPGWLDKSCMYGPSGIVMGVGMGIIRVLFVDNTQKLSFVPVDYVNNATIAAGWEAAVRPNQDINILNLSTTNCDVTFSHELENELQFEVGQTITLNCSSLIEADTKLTLSKLRWEVDKFNLTSNEKSTSSFEYITLTLTPDRDYNGTNVVCVGEDKDGQLISKNVTLLLKNTTSVTKPLKLISGIEGSPLKMPEKDYHCILEKNSIWTKFNNLSNVLIDQLRLDDNGTAVLCANLSHTERVQKRPNYENFDLYVKRWIVIVTKVQLDNATRVTTEKDDENDIEVKKDENDRRVKQGKNQENDKGVKQDENYKGVKQGQQGKDPKSQSNTNPLPIIGVAIGVFALLLVLLIAIIVYLKRKFLKLKIMNHVYAEPQYDAMPLI